MLILKSYLENNQSPPNVAIDEAVEAAIAVLGNITTYDEVCQWMVDEFGFSDETRVGFWLYTRIEESLIILK